MKPLIAFDTETHPISQATQHPRLVCLSLATPTEADLIGNNDPHTLHAVLAGILADDEHTYVGQNLGYDLGVVAANFPDRMQAIFDALNAERFSDTMIREKLLTLATTGDLKFLQLPDGSKKALKWDMAALVDFYFHVDISEDKTDPGSWRLNFNQLDGMPAADYPAAARQYAISDSTWLVGKLSEVGEILPGIWQMQEERRQMLIRDRGIDPFKPESFRILTDFVLKLMSGTGAHTDAARVAQVEAMLAEELKPEKLNLLLETGILRPATLPQPYKNGAQTHVADCVNAAKKSKERCQCPVKMTGGDKETVDTEKLRAYVLAFASARNTTTCPVCLGEGAIKKPEIGANIFIGCKDCGAKGRVDKGDKPEIKLSYTDATEKFPAGQLQVNAEFLDDYAHLDPVLGQYKHRQDLQKLVTTEIPRMKVGPADNRTVAAVVYPQYDVLKETGRTSSFSSKKPEYASFNCQNVDPRVRGCFVPAPGFLLFSVDYSGMELGTLAQTCYELFGYSVMRDQINAGVDVHAYTGSQLAYSNNEHFRKLCISRGAESPQKIYQMFHGLKNSEEGLGGDAGAAFFKHWRKFAKPTNLGYPGGLGAATFVQYAKATYDVIITEEEAKVFRELWKQTYPEMVEYFAYINKQCIDPWNKGWDEDEKVEYEKYHYDSPLGLHRAGCDYCACANGLGLQTRSADGALAGLISVVQACYLGTGAAILGPVDGQRVVKPWGFIHDEIVGEIRDDGMAHERLEAIKSLMVAGMRIMTPDVTPSANAALMRRWNKAAEPVYDANGRLTVWEPPIL